MSARSTRSAPAAPPAAATSRAADRGRSPRSGRRCFAVLPAAGIGTRFGADRPKQYLRLAGRSVLEWSWQALADESRIAGLVVVVAPDDPWIDELSPRLGRVRVARVGGATRRASVSAGLRWLREHLGAEDHDVILVHDAARPGLDGPTLGRLLDLVAMGDSAAAGAHRAHDAGDDRPEVDGPDAADPLKIGALLGQPVVDTVKRTDAGHDVLQTIDRDRLWLAQTPQLAPCGLLETALDRHPEVTDEAAALEAEGLAVRMVQGSPDNFKLTLPGDLPRMEAILMKRLQGAAPQERGGPQATAAQEGAQREGAQREGAQREGAQREGTQQEGTQQEGAQQEDGPGSAAAAGPAFAIGQGYDVHALVPGRALTIGGVTIPHPTGLLGHSDADVLLHAITDAVLGAAGLGDIGRMFPDTDERHRGADSARLLALAMDEVRARGWRVGNVDATVIAQQPRLAPHVPAMVAKIAEALGCGPAQVNVKGKTNERLGFEGRSEGMVAQAAVLLIRA